MPPTPCSKKALVVAGGPRKTRTRTYTLAPSLRARPFVHAAEAGDTIRGVGDGCHQVRPPR
eukprot:8211968-Lingulodinium_polyedra.AAC.1